MICRQIITTHQPFFVRLQTWIEMRLYAAQQ
jgi:hypothetical protein